MTNKKIYLYVIIGTMMMLLLGIVYSYSIFRIEIEQLYGLNKFESGIPFMLVLFFYALFMAIGGIWYQRYSTTLIAFFGTALISGGFLLASATGGLLGISLTYGVMIGSGIGILYGLPLRVVAQLNHPRPGLLTGITLIGFGLSPLLFAPIVRALLEASGLAATFLILGLVYIVVLFVFSILLIPIDNQPKQMERITYPILKDKQFYRVYGLFFIGTFIGLTIIGLTANIGVDVAMLSETEAAFFLGVFSIFNGVGRPLFGYLNDRIGFRLSATLSYASLIVVSLLFYLFSTSSIVFIVVFLIIYLNFGGWLSLAPSATIRLFGKANYSKNYGLMFTAYGFGALIGNALGGSIVNWFTYQSLFLLMAGLAVIGLIIALIESQPNQKTAP